jgi:hypothetical protein
LTLATLYVILIIENKKERTVKMKKAFTVITVISIIGYILLIWAIVSFIDVNLHNSTVEKDCANWNFFKIISSI